MTLQELVKQEEKVIKRIYELKQSLIESENSEANQEYNLWINTDFKKKGLTNADQRKAYVKSELSGTVKRSGLFKNQINVCENVLKIIRFKQKAILEGSYKEDEKEYNFYDEFLDELLEKIE